eukprot:3572389-Ditylum_brightwellii.AAC.1
MQRSGEISLAQNRARAGAALNSGFYWLKNIFLHFNIPLNVRQLVLEGVSIASQYSLQIGP